MIETHAWFAVAAPGLEPLVADELKHLVPAATAVTPVIGGVEFQGQLAAGQSANLWLRTASRVLLRLGQTDARDFAALRRAWAQWPWERYMPPGVPLAVSASVAKCRLFHTGALAQHLAAAIGERTGRPAPAIVKLGQAEAREGGTGRDGATDASSDDGPAQRVFVRGERDRFVVSLDTSGALLHRRGDRVDIGAAPLRETVAAALLKWCGWTPDEPLVDPMCGAGTLVLEAAAIAAGRAPGATRAFAFERWPEHDAQAWARQRFERPANHGTGARDSSTDGTTAPRLWGFDRDPKVIEAARRNAARAGTPAPDAFQVATLGSRPAPAAAGLLVVNPPYGKRLSTGGRHCEIFRALGQSLRAEYRGWRAGILVPNAEAARALDLRPIASHDVNNGGLHVRWLVFAALPGQPS